MKNQLSFLLFIAIFFLSCPSNNNNSTKPPEESPVISNKIPEIPFEEDFPAEYVKIAEATGDLDKDGVAEKVVVVNIEDPENLKEEERVIYIFNFENQEWKLWDRIFDAIQSTDEGGMVMDPLQSVMIENGAIVINHNGLMGNSQWGSTQRYRYQHDKWELIGFTSKSITTCSEREFFDYNLSNGNVDYRYVKFVCDDGNDLTDSIVTKMNFIDKMDNLPQAGAFENEDIKAVNPETGVCVPVNSCYDYNDKNKGNKQVLTMGDLEGVYALGGHDDSWVLTILPEANKFNVNYYKIEGMLPPEEWISEDYSPRRLKKFAIDITDMTFDSDLGKGKIDRSESGELNITFFEIESHIADSLVLSPLD